MYSISLESIVHARDESSEKSGYYDTASEGIEQTLTLAQALSISHPRPSPMNHPRPYAQPCSHSRSVVASCLQLAHSV